MKRSEMIKIMKEAYSDRLKYQMLYFDDELAGQVLDAMEKAGMLPPTYFGYGSCPINKWESEDETK